jgi:hypothetical protein
MSGRNAMSRIATRDRLQEQESLPTKTLIALPAYLRRLAAPSEILQQLEDRCQRYGHAGGARSAIEDDLKLQYYFGGQTVAAAATNQGLEILVAEPPGSQEFARQVAILLQERPDLVILTPLPWNDTQTRVLTPIPVR